MNKTLDEIYQEVELHRVNALIDSLEETREHNSDWQNRELERKIIEHNNYLYVSNLIDQTQFKDRLISLVNKRKKSSETSVDDIVEEIIEETDNSTYFAQPGYYFVQEILHSKYFDGKQETIDKLIEIVTSNTDPYFYRVLENDIIDAGEAKDLDELSRCAELSKYPYTLTSCLGSGASGVTYKATNIEIQFPVAIKVIINRASSRNATKIRDMDLVELLKIPKAEPTEEKILGKLREDPHPNIVQVYDAGDEILGTDYYSKQSRTFGGLSFQNGKPYSVVMEYVDGQTLEDRMKQGPIPDMEALDYSVQLFNGISHLYNNGIFHRDINARNVKINSKGQVKIIDFGSAIEDLEAEPKDNRRTGGDTDFFSWALLTYEMLTGEHLVLSREENMGTKTHAELVEKLKKEIRIGGKKQLKKETHTILELNLPPSLHTLMRMALIGDKRYIWDDTLNWEKDNHEYFIFSQFSHSMVEGEIFDFGEEKYDFSSIWHEVLHAFTDKRNILSKCKDVLSISEYDSLKSIIYYFDRSIERGGGMSADERELADRKEAYINEILRISRKYVSQYRYASDNSQILNQAILEYKVIKNDLTLRGYEEPHFPLIDSDKEKHYYTNSKRKAIRRITKEEMEEGVPLDEYLKQSGNNNLSD